ncbi:MAG: hypothetical protein QXI11_03050 [Thermoproteota archaeon]
MKRLISLGIIFLLLVSTPLTFISARSTWMAAFEINTVNFRGVVIEDEIYYQFFIIKIDEILHDSMGVLRIGDIVSVCWESSISDAGFDIYKIEAIDVGDRVEVLGSYWSYENYAGIDVDYEKGHYIFEISGSWNVQISNKDDLLDYPRIAKAGETYRVTVKVEANIPIDEEGFVEIVARSYDLEEEENFISDYFTGRSQLEHSFVFQVPSTTIRSTGIMDIWVFLYEGHNQRGFDSYSYNFTIEEKKIDTKLTIELDPQIIGEHSHANVAIEGRLTRADTGEGIAGKKISLFCSGKLIGTTLTDSRGNYFYYWEDIDLDEGSYQIRAVYEGDSEYEGSQASTTLGVAVGKFVNLKLHVDLNPPVIADIGQKARATITFANYGPDEIPAGARAKIMFRLVDRGDRENLLNFDTINALKYGRDELFTSDIMEYYFRESLGPEESCQATFEFQMPDYEFGMGLPKAVFADTIEIYATVLVDDSILADASYEKPYQLFPSYEEMASTLITCAVKLIKIRIGEKITDPNFKEALLKNTGLVEAYTNLGVQLCSFMSKLKQDDIPGSAESVANIILIIAEIIKENPISLAIGFIEDVITAGRVIGYAIARFLMYLITSLDKLGIPIVNIILRSPVDILVTTSEGKRIGYLNGQIYEELEGSEVIVIDEKKYILFPKEAQFDIELYGKDQGSFSLEILSPNIKAEFSNIAVTSKTKAYASVNLAINSYVMKKDNDGDGTIDEEIPPLIYQVEQGEEKTDSGSITPPTSSDFSWMYLMILLIVAGVGSVVVLQKHRKFYELSLTILNSEGGSPISSARVFLDGVYRGETDANGGLSIGNVSKGSHTLAIEASGFERKMVEVKIPEQQKLTVFLKRIEPIKPPPPPPLPPEDGREEKVMWLEGETRPSPSSPSPKEKQPEEHAEEKSKDVTWL